MKKSELFQKTAAALLAAPDYRWTNPAKCNVGILIEVARGARATSEEFWQGGGGGFNRHFLWCCRGENNSVKKWLLAEYGITARELESIELLNDRSIVRLLARRGILPAPPSPALAGEISQNLTTQKLKTRKEIEL